MDRVVFLRGERLYLRPMDKSIDLDNCHRWVNDPNVRRFLKVRLPVTRDAEVSWFDDRAQRQDDIQLAIILNEGDRHIGMMGLHRVDWVHRHATTGSLIGESAEWGKGYGSEAKTVLLRYAFLELNLHRISTSVLATNTRSLRCQLKCGYVKEGCRYSRFFVEGKWVDEILLGIVREDWIARQ